MNHYPEDTLSSIYAWFHEAVPAPTDKNRSVQLGCHFEEVKECLESLQANNEHSQIVLTKALSALEIISTSLKKNEGNFQVDPTKSLDFLDSLCDQIVTAVGSGYVYRFDMLKAVDEVDDSNWSKFHEGTAVFDDNGKIAKGPNYFKPDLTQFLPN